MFESAELGHKISKAAYKAAVPELRTGLLQAQAELYENKPFPVLLLISGQDGAGKGEAINLLYEWMDSRFLSTLPFSEPTDEERERPPMWRYWRSLPPKGRLGIFAGSWYSDPIRQRIAGEITLPELDARAAQINRFEAMLAQEGALILKFWFHLTKDAQRERLKALESDPRTAWRVSRWNWDRLKTYDQLQDAAGHLLRITNTAQAPWIVLEGNDDRYRSLSVGQLVLKALRERLGQPTATCGALAAGGHRWAQCAVATRPGADLGRQVLQDRTGALAGAPGRAGAPPGLSPARPGVCFRRARRGGQGRCHPPHRRGPGRAPIPGDPGCGPQRGRARATLSVALLAPPAPPRQHQHL